MDKILPQSEDWQNHPLSEVYPVLYIDAIHYSGWDEGVIRKEREVSELYEELETELGCHLPDLQVLCCSEEGYPALRPFRLSVDFAVALPPRPRPLPKNRKECYAIGPEKA